MISAPRRSTASSFARGAVSGATIRARTPASRAALEVTEAPHAYALAPLGQELRELVQVFVLAAARVHLEEREPPLAAHAVERLEQGRRHASNLAEPRRVEARAVTEHATDLLV